MLHSNSRLHRHRKADATFPIVSAASIAAKVTRDAWIENWVFEEAARSFSHLPPKWLTEDRGSGYPSGKYRARDYTVNHEEPQLLLDPKTKEWLNSTMDKTFGYPSIARFSWATVKLKLDKDAHPVTW